MLVVVFVGLELLLDLLLVGFLMAAVIAVLWHYGPANPGRRHCPACQRDGLAVLEASHTISGRLTLYQCVHCNAGYREQLDGTLAPITQS